MPTALTVVVAETAMEPPLAMYFAVPEPGTGGLPSVVYQMPVLWSRSLPGLVNVTFSEPKKLVLAGEMAGATLVFAQVLLAVKLFPVAEAV